MTGLTVALTSALILIISFFLNDIFKKKEAVKSLNKLKVKFDIVRRFDENFMFDIKFSYKNVIYFQRVTDISGKSKLKKSLYLEILKRIKSKKRIEIYHTDYASDIFTYTKPEMLDSGFLSYCKIFLAIAVYVLLIKVL